MNLIRQPNLGLTRKMAAVGWASLPGPIAAAIIVLRLPGPSDAYGREAGASVVTVGPMLAQGAVTLLVGYVMSDKAISLESDDFSPRTIQKVFESYKTADTLHS